MAPNSIEPKRVPPTAGFKYPRSPHPAVQTWRTDPNQLRTEEDIEPLDLGPPAIPYRAQSPASPPRSAPCIRISTEPTKIHSTPLSPSRCSNVSPQTGSRHGSQKHRRFRFHLPDFLSWFGRGQQEDEDEPQPRRKRSLSWFTRRRNTDS